MNIDLIKQKAGIIGESDAINQVLEMVAQVANVDTVSYTHLTLPTKA